MRGEDPAGRGEGGRPARSIDQLRAELALEGRDVRADPRLGPMDVGGRRGEPAAVDNREEGLQPVQLHPTMVGMDRPARPSDTPWGSPAGPEEQVLRSVSRMVSQE